jgi:hypothetical protein
MKDGLAPGGYATPGYDMEPCGVKMGRIDLTNRDALRDPGLGHVTASG